MSLPSKESIRQLYAGIERLGLTTDIRGWHYDEPIFAEVVAATQPKLIVEIGTHLGASAIRMATLAPDATVITVDLGTDPSVVMQFMHNVKASGLDDRIYPLVQSSDLAATTLLGWGLEGQVDLVYVDGGHDMNTCFNDLMRYWPLLRPGGIMFGDDYTEEPGVAQAVRAFCVYQNVKVERSTYYHFQLEAKK